MAGSLDGVKVVLLDIEGTVCPISFVKDVLFPYALRVLPGVLETAWESPDFAPYRDAFPAEFRTSKAVYVDHVRDLVSRDVKISYLKSLQGYLWKRGYESGELRAPLFPDVPNSFSGWNAKGLRLMIYSSGSVPAQKLLFRHTDGRPKDFTPFIIDFFDTVNAGPKTEAASYEKILAKYPDLTPSAWLFLSDNVQEVDAAISAGMRSCVVYRPGNAELSQSACQRHMVIRDFDCLKLL